MAIVQSVGTVVDLSPGWSLGPVYRGVTFYDRFNYDYATLYRTQPNVRVCVDFLARNIAQLGLHVFRRVDENDRVRLRDHPLAKLIAQPLPAQYKVTRYRLIEALMGDMGIYFNAYWLKMRADAGLSLLRLPPALVEVKGGLAPTGYTLTLGGSEHVLDPQDVVHFRGYNPENAVLGMSPLETLRRVLAEEHASGDYREHFWQNAARMHGIISRPADAPEWSTPARERFKQEFAELYSGADNSGKTAVLEEGMEWKPAEFNAQESEYLAGRKLTREECARAFHIPLPLVGILDHATFSNIKEQHKNLYQDSLGPWLSMIEEDIALQLLPEFPDSAGVYVEFNIQEKLQGAFEEQVTAMQSAVGRPWMTADEARARFNMPSMGGDAEQLVTPLNVLIGGQASPRDTAKNQASPLPVGEGGEQASQTTKADPHPLPLPGGEGGRKAEGELDPTQPALRARYEEQWARLLVRTFERQRTAVTARVVAAGADMPELAAVWDAERWNREVTADFYALSYKTVLAWGGYVAELLKFQLSEEELLPWIQESSRLAAEYVNAATERHLDAALLAAEPLAAVKDLFEIALGVRAGSFALSRVTALANFGTVNAARQGGLRTKTWHVNSTNPRDSHAALNGVTVGIRDTFQNGLRWPGDSRGSADDNAGCMCSMTYGK